MANAASTLGAVDPDTKAIALEVIDYLDSIGDRMPPYPGYPNGVMWGKGSSSEHATGWAIDFMTRNDAGTGNVIAEFLWENRKRFGLRHLIWRQRIRSTVQSPGEWRRMGDRGSPTENHMDHIHALFNGQSFPRREYGGGGGQNETWTPPEPLQENFYDPPVDRTVRSIQKIVGVTVDGLYGSDTEKAVAAYQRKIGVDDDGLWGPATDAAHEQVKSTKPTSYWLPTGEYTVKQIQQIVGVTPDGLYGDKTRDAVRKLQKALGVTADGFWGPKTEAAYDNTRVKRTAPKFPLPRGSYFGPRSGPRQSVSGYHGHREGLRRWQEKMIGRGWSFAPHGADGFYGDTTARVARAFQKEKGLKVDGLIGPATWAAAWTEEVT